MQVFIKPILLFLLLFGVPGHLITLFSQQFEGEILFTRETPEDTSMYIYKIKGDKIRVEELDNNLGLLNYMIVNLSDRTIVAINPGRKLYSDVPVHFWKAEKDSTNFNIIKTQNYQYIKGYKCYQWRVQNKKENTEIAYWVAKEQINFFPDFLKIINRTEKSSAYFIRIPENRGFFPMMSVERSLLRELRMQLSVIKIQKKSLPLSLFEIPADYKMFQKN